MATREWLGNAPAVAQVSTFTPANVEISDVFTITINNKSISYTAAAATVQDVVEGIVALLNASTIPEFAEITWTEDDTKVIATADDAGKPFTATSSATDGGGTDTQTFTAATTTTSEGPNDWSTAENWSGATVPVNSDTVVIGGSSSVNILYGLDQSAITLAELRIEQAFSGKIGLPETNEDDTAYPEYRDTYLKISATALNVGDGVGAGSGRIKINTGSNQTTIIIKNTGQAESNGIPAMLWVGTHASNEINVIKGNLGVAVFAGESATILTLRTTFSNSIDSDAIVRCGDGVTLNGGSAEVIVAGGSVEINSATTLVTQSAGLCKLEGTGAHAECNIDGGTLRYNTNGTLTTGRVGSDGVLDFSKDIRPKTVTNLELHEGSSLIEPNKNVTYTNGIDFYRTGIDKLTRIELGDHYTLSRSSI